MLYTKEESWIKVHFDTSTRTISWTFISPDIRSAVEVVRRSIYEVGRFLKKHLRPKRTRDPEHSFVTKCTECASSENGTSSTPGNVFFPLSVSYLTGYYSKRNPGIFGQCEKCGCDFHLNTAMKPVYESIKNGAFLSEHFYFPENLRALQLQATA